MLDEKENILEAITSNGAELACGQVSTGFRDHTDKRQDKAEMIPVYPVEHWKPVTDCRNPPGLTLMKCEETKRFAYFDPATNQLGMPVDAVFKRL